jgi:hypothetical protein
MAEREQFDRHADVPRPSSDTNAAGEPVDTLSTRRAKRSLDRKAA